MICGNCKDFSTRQVGDLKGHWKSCRREPRWAQVVELRQAGQEAEAEVLVRRMLGIKGPPMTAEARARVLEYQRTHKDEILLRRRQKRVLKRVLSRPRRSKASCVR